MDPNQNTRTRRYCEQHVHPTHNRIKNNNNNKNAKECAKRKPHPQSKNILNSFAHTMSRFLQALQGRKIIIIGNLDALAKTQQHTFSPVGCALRHSPFCALPTNPQPPCCRSKTPPRGRPVRAPKDALRVSRRKECVCVCCFLRDLCLFLH